MEEGFAAVAGVPVAEDDAGSYEEGEELGTEEGEVGGVGGEPREDFGVDGLVALG